MKVYALLGLIVALLYAKYVIPQVVKETREAMPPHLRDNKGGLVIAVGMTLTVVGLLWPLATFFLILHLRYRRRQ